MYQDDDFPAETSPNASPEPGQAPINEISSSVEDVPAVQLEEEPTVSAPVIEDKVELPQEDKAPDVEQKVEQQEQVAMAMGMDMGMSLGFDQPNESPRTEKPPSSKDKEQLTKMKKVQVLFRITFF